MPTFAGKPPGADDLQPQLKSHPSAVGKHPLIEPISAPVVQQRAAGEQAPYDEGTVRDAAARGVATPASPCVHATISSRSVVMTSRRSRRTPVAEAAASTRAMGAEAYATGNHVVLGTSTDLHTVAHEAAHVVQQRGGVQLQGGVGAAGDAHERQADAVADRVVAGQSAEDLLGGGAANRSTHSVQRKEGKDDAKILENQASLKGTDVEIPALEGALLATRKEAVTQGLLSQASFDAGLALSQAMTRLQPAVAANGAIDVLVQETAALAAQAAVCCAAERDRRPQELQVPAIARRRHRGRVAESLHRRGPCHHVLPLEVDREHGELARASAGAHPPAQLGRRIWRLPPHARRAGPLGRRPAAQEGQGNGRGGARQRTAAQRSAP